MQKNQRELISFALTLTTGDYSRDIFVQKNYFKLVQLVEKYKEHFDEILFCLEVLDKKCVETKMHYHGYITCGIDKIKIFNQFLTNYDEVFKKFIDVKEINNMEEWIKYITKQQEIIKLSYDNFYPYSLISKNKTPIIQYKKVFDYTLKNKINCNNILKFV